MQYLSIDDYYLLLGGLMSNEIVDSNMDMFGSVLMKSLKHESSIRVEYANTSCTGVVMHLAGNFIDIASEALTRVDCADLADEPTQVTRIAISSIHAISYSREREPSV